MTKTIWWLRLVGGFYLLLALTSLWILFVDPQMFGTLNPLGRHPRGIDVETVSAIFGCSHKAKL